MKTGRFSDKERDYLINNFYKETIASIAEKLNRPYKTIISVAGRLQLTKGKYYAGIWTDNEIQFLYNNYKTMSNDEISKILNRPVSHIYKKKQELKLYQLSKYTFTDEDDKFIIENYHKMSNTLILKQINCSRRQLMDRKAYLVKQGLIKNFDYSVKKQIDRSSDPRKKLHEDRIKYMQQHYLDDINDLAKALGISPKSISKLASQAGVSRKKQVSKNILTEADRKFIQKNCYKMSVSEITKILKIYDRWQIDNYIHSIAKFGIKRTACEMQVDSFLRILNVHFSSEVPINGSPYRVDFLLKNNIIIEVYGDYYHYNSTRASINKKKPTKQQLAQMRKDINRNIILSSLGYKVLILWEYDIHFRPYFTYKHIDNWIKYFNLK